MSNAKGKSNTITMTYQAHEPDNDLMDERAPLVGIQSSKTDEPGKSAEGASVYSAWFNVTNVTVGAGTLGLPYAMALCGLVLGIVIALGMGLLAWYSVRLLLMACDMAQKKDYQSLCEQTFGPRWAKALDLLVLIHCFSVLVAYMIIIGDLLAKPDGIITMWVDPADTPWYLDRLFVMSMSVVVFVLPLSMLTKFDFLRHTSLVALACMLYLAVCVVVVAIQTNFDDINYEHEKIPIGYEKKVVYGRLSLDICFALPMIAFAFASHLQIPPIYYEMKPRTLPRMMKVVLAAVFSCTALYLTVGIFGYMTFYQTVSGNVFNSYRDKRNIMIIVAKIGLAITLIFSAPLFIYPMRENFIHLIFPARMQKFNLVRHIIVTLCIIGVSLAIALFVTQMQVVLAFAGSTVVAMIMYILPGSFYIRLYPAGSPDAKYHRYGAWATIIFGILMGTLGTITTILDVSGAITLTPVQG